ncbi:hypothetical protein KY328_05950 [Candidatus Woesearchaeota archaeon]|nr:hypothetical protein [Candidatus Woesearchaeota archaeon]MBW3022443.1 hypothetical protein [Candidatus Woesearchaeota archaeon]
MNQETEVENNYKPTLVDMLVPGRLIPYYAKDGGHVAIGGILAAQFIVDTAIAKGAYELIQYASTLF